MKELNKQNVPVTTRPERIIQFGEGNFLRAFVDWIIWNMNAKADFNSSVVVVQPIEKGMVDMLNKQDNLYHVNLQGLDKGETVNNLELIDVISRSLNPYTDFEAFIRLAEQPEMRFVISNTTEAGITFDPACRLEDAPAASYPGKLTQLLYHRFKAVSSLEFGFSKTLYKKLDLKKKMCYYISVVCGCSSMARIPAFQAGRVGSIPITRSKRKVAVKRLFCFLKIRESNLRFALLRFPLLPRCRLQLPTAALRFARCIIRRMRSQPHPSPAPFGVLL